MNMTNNTIIIEKKGIKAEYLPNKKAILCTATDTYIKEVDFKEVFNEMLSFVKDNEVTRFVFDKRNLKVFHQPSMEWYHINWKPEVAKYGVTRHRKILPDNKAFKMSVDIGRKNIITKNPEVEKYDIKYTETLEEA